MEMKEMTRRLTIIAVVTAFILAIASVAMAADDPFVGTWKWISSTPPESAPAGSWWTAKFEIQGNGYHIVQDCGPTKTGNPIHLESTDILDSEEHSLKGDPSADTTVARRIDAYTYEAVNLKNGEEVGRMRFSVSKDGKTLTIFRQNKNPQGEEVTLTRIMAKQ
jgi:hypothetical protein